MKISSLLKLADVCKTQAQARDLLDKMRDAFVACPSVSSLETTNEDANMEDETPFVHFEFNRVISGHYITTIQPEIRDGKATVVVLTNRMLDGMGMQSTNWEVVDGMEEIIAATPSHTVKMLANQAKASALAHHKTLLEAVGVPSAISASVARRSW